MQDGFRQRLVGALVLVCLSLILWPLLFSQEGVLTVDKKSQITAAPNFKKFTVDKPVKPVNMPPSRSYEADKLPLNVRVPAKDVVSAVPAPEEKPQKISVPKTEGSVKPRLNKEGLPVFWALQVASLSKKAKADELKKTLLAKGYKVETRSADSKSGRVIRVYVGPKLDKSLLLNVQKKIDQQFNVKSILVRFTPR